MNEMERALIRRVDNLQFQIDSLAKPEVHVHAGVAVYNDANIAVGTGAWESLTFNQERWDDAGFHSVIANTERLTVPANYDGWYVISGHAAFAASALGTIRGIAIFLNNASQIATARYPFDAALQVLMSVAAVYYLSATDYVELDVLHDVGVNHNILTAGNYSPEFRMVKIS